MKRFFSFFTVVAFYFSTVFAQAPAASSDIMLQGFYWDSNKQTSWAQLYQIAGDISGNFDIVWLPPSAYSSGGVGYIPKQWSNQNSAWGTSGQLKLLISKLRENNCRSMADIVVNHRGDNCVPPYLTFYPDDFGVYGTFQLGLSDICSNDDVHGGTGAPDSGDGFDGARDLDHTSANVKNTIKAYLKWMKNEMGYDGWRYDMVKGFRADVIGEYNDAANAYMSVGEYWDGADAIKTWINYTGQKSMAFDFPLKYDGLRDGLKAGNYANMARGLAFDPTYRKYAVTFVDNHDTYGDSNNQYTGNVLQAYAFLMSSPGIPCVFYPHWRDNKTAINDMIKARKSIGMTSETNVQVQNTVGFYKVFIQGTAGMMMTYIGNNGSDVPTAAGWNLVASGGSGVTSYKIYTNITNPALLNAHQQKINNGVNPPAITPFSTITLSAIVPANWTTTKIHVWNLISGQQITSAAWPGDQMTRVEGNKFQITLSGFTPATMVGVVINNGSGLQTIDLYATQSTCWEVTPMASCTYSATESDNCVATGINDVDANKFVVYPNPVGDELFVMSNDLLTADNVEILDITGKIVINSHWEMGNSVNVSNLAKGIYFVRIGNQITKFIKK